MRLSHDILATFSTRLVLMALALVSSIALARLLGPEGRGLLALVLLLPEWAATLALLGYDQANAVYAGLEPEKRSALTWHSLWIALVLGGSLAVASIAFFFLGAPGTSFLAHVPTSLYLLALGAIPVRFLSAYWGAILRGIKKILLLNTVDVLMRVMSLGLIIALVSWRQLGVSGAVIADVTISVASALVTLALLRASYTLGPPRFDRRLFARTTAFALTAHGGTVAAYLNYRLDQLMIAILLPPEQLGYYAIAVGIAERLWILPGSIATPLLPHLASTPDRDPALAAVIARHVLVWLGLIAVALFALADFAIPFLYSEAFAEATTPLRWLLPGIVTLSVGKILVAEILVREKPRYTLWASSGAALVNLLGNLLLIPRMGTAGAALASSMSYTLLSVVLSRYYLHETGLPWTALLPRLDDLAVYQRLWAPAKSQRRTPGQVAP